MTDALHIISPGPFTTVQDCGRPDAYHLGVPPSGCLDAYASRVANWLVGNPAECAVLEMSMIGIRCDVLSEMDIAVTGARMDLRVNGQQCSEWSTVPVRSGDVVEIGIAENGCRAYLAVTGGIDVPVIMASRSTYTGGRLGGYLGRHLQSGDILKRGAGSRRKKPIALPWTPLYPEQSFIRAIPGPHDHFFRQTLESFFSSTFVVSPQSNRMGYRLTGPEIFRDSEAPASIVSEPVTPGNIQMPPDGQPIVLLTEQTIGGYTIIATVISADLFRIAQTGPGNTVRFIPVTLEEAHRIHREWAGFLAEVHRLLAGDSML